MRRGGGLTKELEIAAAAAIGGFTSPSPAGPKEARCRSCNAPLQGPYCHACGQGADDHHRSILRLALEAIEGVTHLDGRIAKTLPDLFFRPGRLAADYVNGRLSRHIPPLRLFLVSLLIFMLSLEVVVRQGVRTAVANTAMANSIASTSRALSVSVGAASGEPVAVTSPTAANVSISIDAEPTAVKSPAAAKTRRDANDLGSANVASVPGGHGDKSPQAKWIREHLARALANPQFYMTVVFEWAHRLAFLLLPILAAELTVLYFYRRRIYVYDHLLVALQYLSFCFLLWAAVWLLPVRFWGWVLWPALFWTPANLFMTLRGAYGSSVFGAGFKALFLWISTLVAFGVLIIGLLALALGQV